MLKARRKKKCRVCGEWFSPFNTIQATCIRPKCVLEYSRRLEDKRARRKHRQDRERIKPRNKVQAEAQAAFNAFIRLRDEGLPCISCGEIDPPVWPGGGAWDCGHYLTIGAHPELRFVELNAHKQCKSCNAGAGRFSGKGRTVRHNYRERLILRISLTSVEWLEGPHDPNKYSADELRAIKIRYRKKRRELKRCRA